MTPNSLLIKVRMSNERGWMWTALTVRYWLTDINKTVWSRYVWFRSGALVDKPCLNDYRQRQKEKDSSGLLLSSRSLSCIMHHPTVAWRSPFSGTCVINHESLLHRPFLTPSLWERDAEDLQPVLCLPAMPRLPGGSDKARGKRKKEKKNPMRLRKF